MTLQNLLKVGALHPHAPDAAGMNKLLQAAQRNLRDARLAATSNDGRFDSAYRCILQCAMLGLWSAGFRTATSQPGHHHTALQCLPMTLAWPMDEVIVLDALRRQRNLADYQGDPISDPSLVECIAAATRLLGHVVTALRDKDGAAVTPATPD